MDRKAKSEVQIHNDDEVLSSLDLECRQEPNYKNNFSPKLGRYKGRGKLSSYLYGIKKKLSKDRKSLSSLSLDKDGLKSNTHFYYTTTEVEDAREDFTSHFNDNMSSTSSNETRSRNNSESPYLINDSRESLTIDQLNSNGFNALGIEKEKTPTGSLRNSFRDLANLSENNTQFPFYTLSIHLVSGKNLVIRDKSGTSDPYVKFKLADKTLYKSKVIHKNLNPIWNEKFTIPIESILDPLVLKVVDYDLCSKDDFMGMCLIDLQKLQLNTSQTLRLTLSKKGIYGEKPMGELLVNALLCPKTAEEKFLWVTESASAHAQMKMQKQTWNGVLSVLLVDVRDLPKRPNDFPPGSERDPGYTNVFTKLRFGSETRRSKSITEYMEQPEWLEQFDFHLYEGSGQISILELVVLEDTQVGRIPLGSCSFDTSKLTRDRTEELLLKFTNGMGTLRISLTITGFRPSARDQLMYPSQEEIVNEFSLANTLKLESIRDIGHLSIKVIQAVGLRAADIGGKSDPYCVFELGNARVQTHTEYKTLTPVWNKELHLLVRDITNKLELTVYDEDRDYKHDFLGKIIIPLWKIQSGEKVWYRLKNKKLAKGARGNNPQIQLEMTLVWNPIRAAIRVTDPQEVKYLQPKSHFNIRTFLINMERLRRIIMDICDIWLYIKSCLDWEYPERSIKALTLYLLTCYFFQPFFIPLFLLIWWLRPWWKSCSLPESGHTSHNEHIKSPKRGRDGSINAEASDTLDLDDSDDEDELKKLSLLEKFSILQDATAVIQELIGEISAVVESSVNTYRMVIPFIYWLFALLFAAGTITLFLIPLRYVAMILGVHEFLRIYLRPWKQSSFEIYHMIRRVPHNMNLGDKLGLTSVVKSVQQLRMRKHKRTNFGRKNLSSGPVVSTQAQSHTDSNDNSSHVGQA